jgi:hypothetical protein
MAYLEATVVVYLRELYNTGGFLFPIKILPIRIFSIECGREFSTILMLIAVGCVAGRNFYSSFAYFLFTFGIWDIFYYVWLKVLLNWPPSLMTWDVLFLIPVIWVGPVLAPVLCSLTMILLAVVIVRLQLQGHQVKIKFTEWSLIILGAFLVFLTFVWDYSKLIIENNFFTKLCELGTNPEFQKILEEYIPLNYNWGMFLFGLSMIIIAIILFSRRSIKT